MKILSLNQIKKMDQYYIDSKSISSIELMEKAAKSCFEWIKKNNFLKKNIPFTILSGTGKNGGDGLCIAKKLNIYGAKTYIYIIHISNNLSDEFLIKKQQMLNEKINFYDIYENSKIPTFNKKSYLIDTIFGIGLNRNIEKFWSYFFNFINKIKFKSIISIDIPSGIFVEKHNDNFNSIIKATHTLTFQVPKIPFFLPDYEKYIGNWHILNFMSTNKFLKNVKTKLFFIEISNIKKIIKKRKKFSHKGNYGHGLLIGGSYGMIGSMVLSAKACFKSGIGKLTVYIPNCGYDIIQCTIPEAILITDKENYFINNINFIEKVNSIGIGMGMGLKTKTVYAVESFLIYCNNKKKKNLVIDADAINILGIKKKLIHLLPKETIITPHIKEFKRLFGSWENDYQKINILKKKSKEHKIFIILKGAHTIISTPDGEIYFNSTGNPGMSTAGNGDVLTGIIVGFLSQGYSPKESCIISVFLHGLSGDLASSKLGEESITSTDVIKFLPMAFKKIV